MNHHFSPLASWVFLSACLLTLVYLVYRMERWRLRTNLRKMEHEAAQRYLMERVRQRHPSVCIFHQEHEVPESHEVREWRRELIADLYRKHNEFYDQDADDA